MGLFGSISKGFTKAFNGVKTVGANGIGFVSDVAHGKNVAKSAWRRGKSSANAIAGVAAHGFTVMEQTGDTIDKGINYAGKQANRAADLGFRGANSAVDAVGGLADILANPSMLMMGGGMVLLILILK